MKKIIYFFITLLSLQTLNTSCKQPSAGHSSKPSHVAQNHQKNSLKKHITTPDAVESKQLGELTFFDGFPTKQTTQKLYNNLDFSRGVDAFLNGMPAASMYAIREGIRSQGATRNGIVLIYEFKGTVPPIIEAVKQNLVEALLNAGAQVDKKDREGLITALLHAYARQDIDLIKILAQYKANFNILHPKTGRTPLIDAVLKNNLKLVEALLEAGADIDAKDDQGKTAIYLAEKLMQGNRDPKKLEQLNTILELLKVNKFIKEKTEAMEL